jgi:hypothetical protein
LRVSSTESGTRFRVAAYEKTLMTGVTVLDNGQQT